jgi:hypothetical protein
VKALSMVLAIVGAALGPGYYVYCEFFSGRVVGVHRTGENSTFPLDPQMNPITITFNVTHGAASAEFYWATLDSGKRRIAATSFHASSDTTVASASLVDIRVEHAGEYMLRIGRSRNPQQALPGIEFKVRRNTRAADLKIAGVGVLLLVIGLVLSPKVGDPA